MVIVILSIKVKITIFWDNLTHYYRNLHIILLIIVNIIQLMGPGMLLLMEIIILL